MEIFYHFLFHSFKYSNQVLNDVFNVLVRLSPPSSRILMDYKEPFTLVCFLFDKADQRKNQMTLLRLCSVYFSEFPDEFSHCVGIDTRLKLLSYVRKLLVWGEEDDEVID